MTLIFVLHCAL